MRVLLPPSETKRSGGGNTPFATHALSHGELNPTREAVLSALLRLCGDVPLAQQTLKLSAKQIPQISDNLAIPSAPTLPAIDRYTGVLFDALAANELDSAARTWLEASVSIQSALFGLIDAGDPIPRYRLSASTALPGITVGGEVRSLKRAWQEAHEQIWNPEIGFILDLRSKDYVALAPIPENVEGYWVNVVTRTANGAARALNHFNKAAKGKFVRDLAMSQASIFSLEELLSWASGAGHSMEIDGSGAILLFVDSVSLNTGHNE